MKKITVIVFFIACIGISPLFSQDLLVTSEGDSINCKITGIDAEYIHFTFKHKEEFRSTLIAVNLVKSHQYNYFATAIVPLNKVKTNGSNASWRFAFNVGRSNQVAKVADNVPTYLQDYVAGMKKGSNVSGEITYYHSETLGFGMKYLLFNTSNSLDNVQITYVDGSTKTGKMSDNLSIQFIGPFYSIRFVNNNKKGAFIMNLGLGYLGYYDKKVMIDNYTMKGNTAGMVLDLGYEFNLSENFALGCQISYLAGSLSQYDWNDGITTTTIKLEKDTYESLNRLDFSVGLRFNASKKK